MNITQIIRESNKKHSHTSGHIMNAIVDKRNKGSIFDKKSDKFFEKRIKRAKKFDMLRGDWCYDDLSDMSMCGWGDEWWKD